MVKLQVNHLLIIIKMSFLTLNPLISEYVVESIGCFVEVNFRVQQWIETSEHVIECFECFETDGERKTEENSI